ncbi:MAG: DEAD/DEAH box helicase [Candidatus Diapherotrites archaeon]|nr:DEAD/DEAH box helicase [Candidatus Diapherotrites archaeon]
MGEGVVDPARLVLERNRYEDFNPVQKEALKAGVTEGVNLVVASPTASGKTTIAELAMVASILRGKKAVYTSPLRALAAEHYREFARKYPEFRVALSIGDYDSKDAHLKHYDAIFTTYEKLDSLIRHRAPWLPDVGVLVVDEVHSIDSDRGPTLEVLLTRMKSFDIQIVALSATIPNAEEIAGWLRAKLVVSNWRPVELVEGVYYDGVVRFNNGEELRFSSEEEIIEDALKRGKGVLIFAPTRRSAMATARKLREITKKYVRGRTPLRSLAERVLNALESPTAQCKELAEDILHGVAFHHAGLVQKQREVVEEGFRSGKIKVVVATPTLAAGVNLPAFRVIITSLRRSEGFYSREIPVREYKQMAGRAGRPRYDERGEAIIIARTPKDAEHYFEKYVMGEPEEVYSRLSSYRAIRFHTLGLIADRTVRNRDALLDFFASSFFFYQSKDVDRLEELLSSAVLELELWEMIKDFEPTRLGSRVASLYIDPETGRMFYDFSRRPKLGEVPVLFLIASSVELYPYLPVSRKEEMELLMMAEEMKEELPVDFEEALNDIHFLNRFKLALLLSKWVNEADEDEILKEFGVSPGQLRGIISIAEWLAHSLGEIAKVAGSGAVSVYAKKMEARIRHGVKEELLPLVELKGIGRKRARKLFNAGFTSPEKIKRADPVELAKLLGPKVALNILKQLKVKVGDEVKERIRKVSPAEQTTLEVFMGGAPGDTEE